jgi:Tryptophan synthase beta chain
MDHQINGIALPNEEGFFGEYGGQFIPPDLKQAMDDINVAYEQIRHTEEFQNELKELFAHYVGRPSPLFYAKRLSDKLGGHKST